MCVALTDPLASSPTATFGGNDVAVLPEFSITVRNLPDLHVVTLHGELDVASADGLSLNSLVELAGSTLVVDFRASRSWIRAALALS